MGAGGDALRELVADIRSALEEYERVIGARKRARRANDQARYSEGATGGRAPKGGATAAEVVVATLAHEVLIPTETRRLAVSTRNTDAGFTCYDNPALGKPLRDLLSRLQEIGVLALAMQ